jgi:hypothetical protein
VAAITADLADWIARAAGPGGAPLPDLDATRSALAAALALPAPPPARAHELHAAIADLVPLVRVVTIVTGAPDLGPIDLDHLDHGDLDALAVDTPATVDPAELVDLAAAWPDDRPPWSVDVDRHHR